MEDKCLFCDLYEKREGIIYETQYFFSRFDKFPISPGHAEIIPKKHIVSLLDLTKEEWADLQVALKETVETIEATELTKIYKEFIAKPFNEKSIEFCERILKHPGMGRKPDGYNFGNNEGEAAGRTIHHLHIHIIPRYFGDVADPRGGIRYILPEFANYRK